MTLSIRRLLALFLGLALVLTACGGEETTGDALSIDPTGGDGGGFRDPSRTTTTLDPAIADAVGEETTTTTAAAGPTETTAPQATTTTAPRNIIKIQDDDQGQFFEPFIFQVPVGQPVVWVNVGQQTRQIVSDGLFASPEIPPGGEFSFTFGSTGVFDYRDVTRPYATSGRVQVY